MQLALGLEIPAKGFFDLDQILPWAQIERGVSLDKPEILFPRIDIKERASNASPQKAVTKKEKAFKPALKEEISIDDFSKIDLRAATILSAEKIETSSKLVKLIVDLGAQTRQVIAGIGKSYTPQELVGKQVIVVANLKEARIMGELSQGMVLAASHKKKLILSGFEKDLLPGNPVK
jgi:methionyl-tRNA synthetase